MKNREELLIKVIHFLSEKLKTDILLEGGMLLRLLNCPRSTQDVDYILLSSASKKDLSKKLEKILSAFAEIKITGINLNSRGIFIDVVSAEEPSIRASVEISVKGSSELPIENISTSVLANKHSLPTKIVSTIALSEAFSNKIAAALERNSVRDLYDIAQLEPLCPFDAQVLKKRLNSFSMERTKPKSITFAEAAKILRAKSERITEEILIRELYPLLPPEQRSGLLMIIKAAVHRVAARLSTL